MSLTSMQILHHFIHGAWALMDFGLIGDSEPIPHQEQLYLWSPG